MQNFFLLLKKYRLFIIIALVIILTSIPSVYFYQKYQETQMILKDPASAAKLENKKILEKVGKLLELPSDEEPTIATVSDSEKLKDRPFFSKAKNGDKVIIYTNARKAILYDPIANKIIDMAPVNIGTPSAATPSPVSSTLRIALYNGTNITGLTKNAEKELLEKMPNIAVVMRENAKRKDYEKTLVVDLTGTKKEEAQKISSLLKGEVGNLPPDESKPEASASAQPIDFLAIIGKSYTEK